MSTFRQELADRFPLATKSTKVGENPVLVEVYPHIGLHRLMAVKKRLRYKIASPGQHSSGSGDEQVRHIAEEQGKIIDQLAKHIQGIPPELAIGSARAKNLASLKIFAGAIDALVCAWIGGQYLDRNATAHGHDDAAIWVPGPAATPKPFPPPSPEPAGRVLRQMPV